MARIESETDDVKSLSISERSLLSESTSATSVSLERSSSSDNDIFDTSDDHQHPCSGNQAPVVREEMLSDLPAVQRQHMTSGYREGLSDSKSKSMQGGFDQGYPIGFELGLKVGKVFGVLEGFLAALAKNEMKTPPGLVELFGNAKKELAISILLNGLEDEVLARPDFEVKDLPLRSREALQKWEEVVTQMIRG